MNTFLPAKPQFAATETDHTEDQIRAGGVVAETAENGETETYFIIVTVTEHPENFLPNQVCAVTGHEFQTGDQVQVTQIRHHSTDMFRWEETWFAEPMTEE